MRDKFQLLLDGGINHILVNTPSLPEQPLLYPGSFNPFHQGHKGLLKAAETISHRKGLLELSVKNVDKPAMAVEEVERRLAGISQPLVLSCAPTFIEKAYFFPGSWFAMGYDTAIRLLDPKYHPNVPSMLQKFRALDIKFVVAGRLHCGIFQSLDNVDIPKGFEDLFIPIPEELFRADISSTEIRTADRLAEPTLQRCSVGSMSRDTSQRKFKDKPPRLERIFQKYDPPLYFITFNTTHRRKMLDRQEVHDAFISYAEKNASRGRAIGRYVIMPDHIHLFVRIEGGSKLSDFVRLLKQELTKTLRGLGVQDDIWQPGFFDRLLRYSESYYSKWNYVRENPVRAGLVREPDEWPWQGEVVRIDRV